MRLRLGPSVWLVVWSVLSFRCVRLARCCVSVPSSVFLVLRSGCIVVLTHVIIKACGVKKIGQREALIATLEEEAARRPSGF